MTVKSSKRSKQTTLKAKKATAKADPYAEYKTGEQLPLFEMPPTTANPAITKGLDRLKELLVSLDITVKDYNELYEAAVAIIKFTANKERMSMQLPQSESEAQNGKQ